MKESACLFRWFRFGSFDQLPLCGNPKFSGGRRGTRPKFRPQQQPRLAFIRAWAAARRGYPNQVGSADLVGRAGAGFSGCRTQKIKKRDAKASLFLMVGVRRLERPASWSRTKHKSEAKRS